MATDLPVAEGGLPPGGSCVFCFFGGACFFLNVCFWLCFLFNDFFWGGLVLFVGGGGFQVGLFFWLFVFEKSASGSFCWSVHLFFF